MRRGWVQVDLDTVEKYGPAAAVLLGHITYRCRLDGGWVATRKTMVDETGLTPSMIRTAVKVLRDAGLVDSHRADPFQPFLTWTVFPGHIEKADSAITVSSNPPSRDGHIPPSPEKAESAISTVLEELVEKTLPPLDDDGALLPVQAAAKPLRVIPDTKTLDAEFTRFWELYPRRTGKKAARAAYGRARRTATVQAIAAGLHAQLPDLAGREPQYVPHPTTWLNQGRWDDELPGARVSTPDRYGYDPAAAAALPPPRTDAFG